MTPSFQARLVCTLQLLTGCNGQFLVGGLAVQRRDTPDVAGHERPRRNGAWHAVRAMGCNRVHIVQPAMLVQHDTV